jgi:hypothetical protein
MLFYRSTIEATVENKGTNVKPVKVKISTISAT